MKKATLITTGMLAALFATAPAMAEETPCTGTIGAVALDNIFVPDGATCTLNRTRANGSVVVGTGSTLVATGVSINGNIQAEGARSVVVQGSSTVGGSIQHVQGGSARIDRVRVNGDILFDANRGLVSASNNNVGGNLQAFQNLGGVTLTNNFMKGNLQCKENIPAPTGGGNRASSKEDQCARL
jgi:hypothetical protein